LCCPCLFVVEVGEGVEEVEGVRVGGDFVGRLADVAAVAEGVDDDEPVGEVALDVDEFAARVEVADEGVVEEAFAEVVGDDFRGGAGVADVGVGVAVNGDAIAVCGVGDGCGDFVVVLVHVYHPARDFRGRQPPA